MTSIEISVCIPVYNVENYIAQCLDSIKRQTILSKIELIIINDCTPDNSMDVVSEFLDINPELKERTTIIKHEKNKGLAAARNTGLMNSKGKYIIQVDSDDWIEPTYLEELYNKAEESNADITGCDYFLELPEKTITVREDLNKSPEDCLKYILQMCQGIIWTKLIKKELFTANKIEWIEGLDMGEDLLICSKLFAKAEKVSDVDKPLYHYRKTNPNSFCNDSSRNRIKLDSLIRVTENVIDYLRNNSSIEDEYFRKMMARMKYICLFMVNKDLRREVYSLYLDSDIYLIECADSRKKKFLMWLIKNRFYRFSDLLFFIQTRG